MSKILIVADDLTGANANGSLLANKGFSAATCLDREQWNAGYFSEFDAVTLNTDSRLLPPREAGQRVYDGYRLLLEHAAPAVIAKRIDSTLRGNIGAELDAALQAVDDCPLSSEPALAVVVPSFPASDRLAVGGYLLVNGIPLEKSPIARDPIRPITTSRFVDIVKQQSAHKVGYIPLDTVLEGPGVVRSMVAELKNANVRIICCDAATNDDIAVIARALDALPYPVIAVDPGPFTAAMADVRVPVKARHELEDNILAVVGSVTGLIQRQLEALRLSRNCVMPKVDCRALVNPATRDKAISDVVARVSAAVGTADVYGVCTAERPEDTLSLDELAAENGIPKHIVSERINTGLAEIGEALLELDALHIGGIYTSGGEVTVAMARRLNASGFAVRDEILPLAVYGRLIGGKYPNFPMVTKGGFVGDNSSIVECVNYLFTKISSQTKPAED
ncbi:MAG: four-carbon acid sugar kinase family protein [Methylobacteriaceae bacterium]|jgi:uncharacterized protein YgbK (DUF1537 family)|nr:four-carbon acid sugar kinase family protein [Methylobacteriaceae bacterium]